jgi:hypothetical protein
MYCTTVLYDSGAHPMLCHPNYDTTGTIYDTGIFESKRSQTNNEHNHRTASIQVLD